MIQKKAYAGDRGYLPDYHPNAKGRSVLAIVLSVLDDYRDHWPLTIRQVFYRSVAAHGYPKTQRKYLDLCRYISTFRRAGLVPWSAIRNDSGTAETPNHYRDADEFLALVRRAADAYTKDRLALQQVSIEVWCEAAGMVPQLVRVAAPYSIPVYSSGGFDTLTAKYDLVRRAENALPKRTVVLHFGDHDPSGEALFNVLAEDVNAFLSPHGADFRRVALTRDQVEEYDLPTDLAKKLDTRTASWMGHTCQLEALPPDMIASLLQQAILDILDSALLAKAARAEKRERATLRRLLNGTA